MDDKSKREAFIAKSVDSAMVELADMRRDGKAVCDIAFIEGTMAEAAKRYDRSATRT